MDRAMGKWMAGIVAAMALAGCGNAKCDELGEHMADVVFEEARAAGDPVADDKRAELVKKTIDACNAEPPPADHLECALKADSTVAMKACEGVQEDAAAGSKTAVPVPEERPLPGSLDPAKGIPPAGSELPEPVPAIDGNPKLGPGPIDAPADPGAEELDADDADGEPGEPGEAEAAPGDGAG